MKKIYSLIAALTLCTNAMSQTLELEVLVPSRPGGAMQQIMNSVAPAAAQRGIIFTPKYLGTCEKVLEVLNSESTVGGKPMVYAWFNDLACQPPAALNSRNLLGVMANSPSYLCGKKASLSAYRGVDNLKLAVNSGADNLKRGEQLAKALGSGTRVISYANSGAIKTAFVSDEVDLILNPTGPVLAKENSATCYAVTSAAAEPGMVTVNSLDGSSPIGVVMTLTGNRLSAADFARVQTEIQSQLRTPEYRDLVIHKMNRQMPPASIEAQVQLAK